MTVPAGTWVQIESIVLPVGERAPQVPPDTKATPLLMWVKGWLVTEASMGIEVEVRTTIGRHLRGRLVAINPGYEHSFGAPITVLQQAGEQARLLLAQGVNDRER